ncbi:hypothetical protein D3C72_1894910 [compost metagenome]
MILETVPAWNAPTVMTAACSGSTLRATIVCKAITMEAPATTGSAAWCGIAAWPPTPSSVMVTLSAEACAAPSRNSRRPDAVPGTLCMAKTASQGYFLNSPSSIIFFAPPNPSSAGWKIRFRVPLKSPRRARYFAAQSSMVVCPSCPQACITPGWQLA